MALKGWSDMTEDYKAVYRNIALDMNKKSKEEVDDCPLNQQCKEEVNRCLKADLFVLQYQA